MIPIRIDPATPADLPQIFELYKETVAFPHPARMEEYWNWKFCRNPGGETPRFWAAREADKVVGVLGQLPVVVDVRGTAIPAAWAVDFMVDRRFRDRGIGRSIFDRFRQSNTLAMALGFAPASATDRIVRTLGFQAFAPTPNLFRWLTVRAAISALPLSRLYAPLAGRLSRAVLRPFSRLRVSDKVRVEEFSAFGPSFDALWAQIAAENAVTVRRDYRSMNWRYVENPFARYRILGCREGNEMVACLVARIVRGGPFVYGTIAEVFAKAGRSEPLETLLARLLEIFQEEEVDIVKSLGSLPAVAELLRCAGFRAAGRGAGFAVALSDAVEPRIADALVDAGAWYLAKGDSDLDMVPDFQSRMRL